MPSTNRKRKELFRLRSSIDQRKIEFEKKSKVTNDVKIEEVSFWFIYYFKNFGKIKLVSSKLWTYLCKYILSYLAQRISVNHSKRLNCCCR